MDRELIGVCKQSMLTLRQQLRQYINELHAESGVQDVDSYILTAASEVGFLTNWNNYLKFR